MDTGLQIAAWKDRNSSGCAKALSSVEMVRSVVGRAVNQALRISMDMSTALLRQGSPPCFRKPSSCFLLVDATMLCLALSRRLEESYMAFDQVRDKLDYHTGS